MRAMSLLASPALVVVCVGVGFSPRGAAAQSASLKDIQRSIRERLLTEAGAPDQVYTKVDFSHCAATIQSRSLKQPGSREVRVTTTFHLASLDPVATLAGGGPPFVVRVSSQNNEPGFRQIQQVIDSGMVRESVTVLPALEIGFLRRNSADIVKTGFGRLATMCRNEDPLLRGPGEWSSPPDRGG
jgi:hypothetical protein